MSINSTTPVSESEQQRRQDLLDLWGLHIQSWRGEDTPREFVVRWEEAARGRFVQRLGETRLWYVDDPDCWAFLFEEVEGSELEMRYVAYDEAVDYITSELSPTPQLEGYIGMMELAGI